MPKMKSKRALLKRIKVTGSGKVKIFHSHVSHLSHNKTTKQKRHLRMPNTMAKSDVKRVRILIQK
ncbi:MAG: 50S ribosomal protein L35 [Erysipelotrichaceae bacterium]|nr:50S ribosomal protein L35 [Erysipelotrichaceae bacterium]